MLCYMKCYIINRKFAEFRCPVVLQNFLDTIITTIDRASGYVDIFGGSKHKKMSRNLESKVQHLCYRIGH